jgi:hypothetical protein
MSKATTHRTSITRASWCSDRRRRAALGHVRTPYTKRAHCAAEASCRVRVCEHWMQGRLKSAKVVVLARCRWLRLMGWGRVRHGARPTRCPCVQACA